MKINISLVLHVGAKLTRQKRERKTGYFMKNIIMVVFGWLSYIVEPKSENMQRYQYTTGHNNRNFLL